MAEPTFDHERLDVYRLAIGHVAFSFQIAKIQRTAGVSEDRFEYEHEYRDAEYEYESTAET